MSSLINRIKRRFTSKYLQSEFDQYQEYIDIQHRCDPKEFMDHRVNVVSGIVFALNELKRVGVSKKAVEEEGKAKGQLKEDCIDILDAGTRDGWLLDLLKSLGYPNAKGVELLGDYAKYAREKGRDVVQGDLHALPFESGQFDFVHSRHTLEHCLDPTKVLAELMRVLRVNGALYCSFPLVAHPHGKHTLAFPNLRAVQKMLDDTIKNYKPIYVGMTKQTPVIPEAEEVMIFIQKK